MTTINQGRFLGEGVAYHSEAFCQDGDYPCAVHSPSPSNRLATWDFVVRLDKYGLMERFCEHGVGHTDPDSLAWCHRHFDDRFGSKNVRALGLHGCDGCCRV